MIIKNILDDHKNVSAHLKNVYDLCKIPNLSKIQVISTFAMQGNFTLHEAFRCLLILVMNSRNDY